MVDDVTIIGVYDADGSLVGEARYWIGARLGRTHCSLCEITHGIFREKAQWRSCRDSLGIEFSTFHRNDAPGDVLDVCGAGLPAVVVRTGATVELLLGPSELDALDGDVDQFRAALVAACSRRGIVIG